MSNYEKNAQCHGPGLSGLRPGGNDPPLPAQGGCRLALPDLPWRLHRISRHTGLAEWSADGFKTVHPAGFSESMVFYDLLCNAKPGAVLAGQFVNQSQLARLHSGALAPGSSTSGKAFDGREAALSAACEAMGGGKTIGGDVAYLLPLLEQIPVVLRFWSSDDEFPASLQLSWDKNILDFLHYETVCYAAGYLLDRLRAAMES